MPTAKTIMLVFGTRPEAIKLAPLYAALRARPEPLALLCCATGQHRGLLDQALASFGMPADFDLDLMREGRHPGELAAAITAGVGTLLRDARPDLVLVHGDTTTAMAGALAAFHAGIPVGHVEAGLRSGDLASPFPEEFNRRTVTLAARHHFAPTAANRDNLLAEGCDANAIHVTGNTGVDALLETASRLDTDESLRVSVNGALDRELKFDWRRERFVLVTCHRREAFGAGLEAVCAAVAELAAAHPGVRFVWPVHPNPQVAPVVHRRLHGRGNVHLLDPLPYEAMVALLRACRFALTDSGGIQEEAPSFGKPVLVMRAVTERPEAVAAGAARLVGTDRDRIVAAASELLGDDAAHAAMVVDHNPFGDGRAAARIAEVVAQLQARATLSYIRDPR